MCVEFETKGFVEELFIEEDPEEAWQVPQSYWLPDASCKSDVPALLL